MMGTPSSTRRRLHSSLCCFVTRTVRLLYFSISSAVFVCMKLQDKLRNARLAALLCSGLRCVTPMCTTDAG